jgi:hypothetical protein
MAQRVRKGRHPAATRSVRAAARPVAQPERAPALQRAQARRARVVQLVQVRPVQPAQARRVQARRVRAVQPAQARRVPAVLDRRRARVAPRAGVRRPVLVVAPAASTEASPAPKRVGRVQQAAAP